MTGPTREEVAVCYACGALPCDQAHTPRPQRHHTDDINDLVLLGMARDELAAENADLRERLEAAEARGRDMHRRAQKAEGHLDRITTILDLGVKAFSRDSNTWWIEKYLKAAMKGVRRHSGTFFNLEYSACSSVFEREKAALIAQLTESRAREAAAWEAAHSPDPNCGRCGGEGEFNTGTQTLTGQDIFEDCGCALTPPTDATAALTAVKDAEWNAAIEALREAVISRFEISPITVQGTTIYGHGMIRAHPLLHEIDALRRNPKEGV